MPIPQYAATDDAFLAVLATMVEPEAVTPLPILPPPPVPVTPPLPAEPDPPNWLAWGLLAAGVAWGLKVAL